MTEIKICMQCKRSIPQRDIDEGRAILSDGKWICATCRKNVAQRVGAGGNNVTAERLEATHNELKNIARLISFQKQTVWEVFFGIFQCIAFGMVFFAYVHWDSSSTQFLLLAVFFQLLAMTALLWERA